MCEDKVTSECVLLLLNRSTTQNSPDVNACVMNVLLRQLQYPISGQLQHTIIIFLQKLQNEASLSPLLRIECTLVAYYCTRSSRRLSSFLDATLTDSASQDIVLPSMPTASSFVSLFIEYVTQQREEGAVEEASLLCLLVVKAASFRDAFVARGGLHCVEGWLRSFPKNQAIVSCVSECLCLIVESEGTGKAS